MSLKQATKLVKNYQIKKLLVCAALSLVVHTGLAATFVYAVKPVPITIDLVKTIQVSLIEDYSDVSGTSNSGTVSSEALSNPAHKITQDSVPDTADTPTTDSTNDFDVAISELQITEVETLSQRIHTSALIESKSELEFAKNKKVAAVPEPKIEIVDKTAKLIPASIESSLTEIPGDQKLEQADFENSDSSSNQSHLELPPQAIEKHAYRNHPDSGTVLRNVPIVKPLSDSDTFLEFSDFDREFKPWIRSDQESGSILQATLNLDTKTALLEKVPQIGEDADNLAGIAAQPESYQNFSTVAEFLTTKVSHAEHASVKPIEQLASVIDYDNQFQLLPQPELDVIPIQELKAKSQPNIKTEIVDTPNESSFARINVLAPGQPKSDHDLPPTTELLATEVSRTERASIEPVEQFASVIDYDSQVQLLPQPELDAIEIPKSDEKLHPSVATEIVNTPDESLLAKINVPAPTQHKRSVRQSSLSVPSPSEHQKPVSDTAVASAVPATINSKPKHQSDQQITIPNDFLPEQNSPVESPSIDDSQQLASLNNALFDSAPEYGIRGLSNPAPRYPYRSRINGEQGKVILEVLVDREGRAVEISIAKSSGFSRLDKAARKAVKRWQFQPALKSGRKVQGVVRVPISFVLKNT